MQWSQSSLQWSLVSLPTLIIDVFWWIVSWIPNYKFLTPFHRFIQWKALSWLYCTIGRALHQHPCLLRSWVLILRVMTGYFLAPDPIFLPKMLISDPKNDENFDPWPIFVVSLIPDSMRKTMLVPVPRNVNPDPWLRSLIPALFSPLIPNPVYLVTTLLSRFMVSFQDE